MRKGDLVHTPAGWALVAATFDVVAVYDGAPHDGAVSSWVAVMLEAHNGDDPVPAVFLRDEVEPAVGGEAAHE